jgi:DNA-binding CsgD family transcriptional regulator/PAS domain-containing protein
MVSFDVDLAHDELIRAVYRGPLEQPLWHSFLEQLRMLLDASFATLMLRPPREGDGGVVLNALVVSPAVSSSYNDTWFALDPFVDLPLRQVVTLREFTSAEALPDTEYYQQYVGPIGISQIMGVDMAEPEGLNARLRVTRNTGQPDFNEDNKQILRRILPHLEQAIAIHSQLTRTESERSLYEDAVDQLSVGTFILDEQARIIRMNDAARQLVNSQKGICIVDGKFSAGTRQDNQRFKKVLDEVLRAHQLSQPGFVRAFKTERSPGVMKLGMLVRPLPISPSTDPARQPSVAIFVSDPQQRQQVPRHILTELFDFTPAEASLALLLANGLTLDEASEELQISRNTAKSHLSSVFAKTDVSRQTKLVQLILKSVAPMSPTISP